MSKARSRARRMAMQGLYEWQLSDNAPQDILISYHQQHDLSKVDRDYFQTLLLGIPKNIQELDQTLTPYLSRPIKEIDPIELAILRLATYEFINCLDVPYRVVINEAVELAKTFGGEAGHKFVNGILDKVATSTRSAEVKSRSKPKG
jgi:N utilization substance protein B